MKRIFVIEDDEILRENLISLLEIEGYKVFSSEEGNTGLELIKEILPDLIICDIMLPDIDGYEIAKNLKSNESTKYIPFIFLTARSEMKDLRLGMNLGADDYLAKPYDSKELLNVLRLRLDLRKGENGYSNEESEPEKKLEINDNIFVKTSNQVKKILPKEIVCIMAEAEYSELFLENGNKIIVRKLIKSWEEILPAKYFIRIHKSILINLEYLIKIEKWFNNSYKVYLAKYPETLISSRRYSAKLRSKMLS